MDVSRLDNDVEDDNGGEDGEDGEDGKDGEDGEDGKNCEDCEDGEYGEDCEDEDEDEDGKVLSCDKGYLVIKVKIVNEVKRSDGL